MNQTHRLLVVGGVGALALAAGGLWLVQRRAQVKRTTPQWTDAHQPPEGIVAQPAAAAAWCATRPPLPACRAGNRVLRTYAPSLVDEPESLVRGCC